MSRLPFELSLALRYLRPKSSFVSVITMISITGVMLGVAVLLVVIAVMSGFDREWRERILSFNAHLKIIKTDSTMKDYALVCESYHQAIRTAPPSRIQAIDMGRRALHNDGSVLLQLSGAGNVGIADVKRFL